MPAISAVAVDLLARYPTPLTAGDAVADNARPWDFEQGDIYRVSQFTLKVGDDFKVETGASDLAIGHCTDGAVWAVLIPRDSGALTSSVTNQSESIANVWLRFHPGQINRLFPPETIFADGNTNLAFAALKIADSKFTSSWHTGMNALIPEPKDVTVYVTTRDGSRRFFMVDTEAKTAGYVPAFNEQPGRQSSASSSAIKKQLQQALDESDLGKREAELNKISRSIPSSQIQGALDYLIERKQTGAHSLFNDLCSKWGSKDAAAAIAWATNLPDADARKSALTGIYCGWLGASPGEASASALTLSTDNFHDEVILAVANSWSFKDAGAAAEWVSHFPKGDLRDQAVGPVMFWGQGAAPAAVAQMLDTIGDDELTQKYGEQLAQIWLTRDDVEARAWIKRSPLSEKVKEQLLKSDQ
ncbi:MAG: hypothetical protein ACLQSR_04535 [Limisphaerales bacterium]